ncbi:TetR/AcrR family transcriptional regulator [Catenulispora sp. EB89]|uniref:TetR/AcrR family transcriptional regulator n=1 Tax=Catenulispora sp. EB89 TaxID=3156257 RepID=UPI0035123F2C
MSERTGPLRQILEHAGVAKGSLYNTFGSKEALVRAYLSTRHEGTTGRLERAIDAAGDPREKILAVFDAQAQIFRQPDFHGCAFAAADATAEPGGQIKESTEQYRSWIGPHHVHPPGRSGRRPRSRAPGRLGAWANNCNCSTTAGA